MNKKLKQMKPPHPGESIREEIWELVLTVELAAEVLGVHPATLFDLLTEEAAFVPGNGHAGRKGFWPQHGYPAAQAGMP